MNQQKASGLTLNRRGDLAEIIIDRPEKRNALTYEMWEYLPHIVAEVEEDDSVKVLVVQGRGGTFSTGADISEFETRRSDTESARAYSDRTEEAELALIASSKPSIAMIEGYCLGGGCELALACDLRFAASTAIFGITPAKLGIVYGFASTRQLVSVVGPAYAKYLLFSGAHIDSEEAHRARLVDHLFDVDDLEDKTLSFAHDVASRSQISVRGAKTMVGKVATGITTPDEEAQALPVEAIYSADYREGVRAFLEKRSPRFN